MSDNFSIFRTKEEAKVALAKIRAVEDRPYVRRPPLRQVARVDLSDSQDEPEFYVLGYYRNGAGICDAL